MLSLAHLFPLTLLPACGRQEADIGPLLFVIRTDFHLGYRRALQLSVLKPADCIGKSNSKVHCESHSQKQIETMASQDSWAIRNRTTNTLKPVVRCQCFQYTVLLSSLQQPYKVDPCFYLSVVDGVCVCSVLGLRARVLLNAI